MNGEAGPKGGGQDARSQEKEPREMAWFNPPELHARRVEGFGATPAYAIDGAATPRRIWELRGAKPCCRFAPSVAVASASARWERAASPGHLGGGEAGTSRPRSGRAHGWARLFARAGARSKSPAPPHALAGQEARRAPIGVPFLFGSFLFGQAKRKELDHRQVDETALFLATGGRNRSVPCGSRTKPPCRSREGNNPLPPTAGSKTQTPPGRINIASPYEKKR